MNCKVRRRMKGTLPEVWSCSHMAEMLETCFELLHCYEMKDTVLRRQQLLNRIHTRGSKCTVTM